MGELVEHNSSLHNTCSTSTSNSLTVAEDPVPDTLG